MKKTLNLNQKNTKSIKRKRTGKERKIKREKKKEEKREVTVGRKGLKGNKATKKRSSRMKRYLIHLPNKIQEAYQKRRGPERKRKKTRWMKMTLTLTWENICFELDINLMNNINIHHMGFFNDFLSGNTKTRYVSNRS